MAVAVALAGLVTVLVQGAVSDSSTCNNQTGFRYQFTECDESGGRWRVSVPSATACFNSPPPPPTRVSDCTPSCKPGRFFNLTSLSCSKCPAGSYSLGGGQVFDEWAKVPNGFQVVTEPFKTSFLNVKRLGADINCDDFGWQPRGEVLSSAGGPCSSALVYAVHLVEHGKLMFEYQNTNPDVLFKFLPQDDQCQQLVGLEDSTWPALTKEGEWKNITVPLKKGLNVLHWKTIGMDLHTGKAVLIKRIEISGVAYTSSCTPCKAGTYSHSAQSRCRRCAVNTHSQRGASQCQPCNKKTEYAPRGSPKCYKRQPCSSADYYELHSPCVLNKTRLEYHWVEPKICREDLPGAETLPPSGSEKPCPPCSPGMQHGDSLKCEFCGRGAFSDGTARCQACPPNTAPDYGYHLTSWSSLPPDVTATCMSFDNVGCSSSKSWQAAGDHVHSGRGQADGVYLVLSLVVAGFRSAGGVQNGAARQVGDVSFSFEVDCKRDCEFAFMQSTEDTQLSVVKSWTGRQERQRFTYPITHNTSYTFSWVFQKMGWDEAMTVLSSSRLYDRDMVRIYSINVTNTIDGGAASCLPCPQGTKDQSCVPCPPGHYVEAAGGGSRCVRCPPDTVVMGPLSYGRDSCQPCGPGLSSSDGERCTTSCKANVSSRVFDFSRLNKPFPIEGSTLFTASGTQYFHLFNMSLCGGAQATCKNNVSYHDDGVDRAVVAESFLCRSTVVPAHGEDGSRQSYSVQSVSLADHLLGVTEELQLGDAEVYPEFRPKSTDSLDLHLFFTSPFSTRACPNGRSATVTVRYNPERPGNGTVLLPSRCPDGTCDGCIFHFLWETALAGPACLETDYVVVKGECEGGQQELHYLPPKNCIAPQTLSEQTRKVACKTHLPFTIQVTIVGAVSFALCFFLLLCHFYKKNQNLEYKYMKLVKSAGSKDQDGNMVLPSAESCALDEGEEDDVQIHQGRTTSGGLFSRIKHLANDKVRNPLEVMQLAEHQPLT
ncbi:endosome/lysosome-associated apoptosis and autophagy regulator family member 2-like isoform X2 [Amphibalanus amphitrite]|uniref:endosome/lysosome-associated apoptosis and autophagy regulator family member 2-like isoform X2 n=1 Tax=Amphibalanus amphitrite TaxID=1232801 RepID=UPI001C8FB1C6|nr:endosome/lysosome-associated apoptosis and autophagy regulator family member 2-like isoform X2 [Amphibalanus amphitrite]